MGQEKGVPPFAKSYSWQWGMSLKKNWISIQNHQVFLSKPPAMTRKAITELARSLRKNQTPAEQRFWEQTCNRQFYGKKIVRQRVVSYAYVLGKTKYYILDFYCHEHLLAIEIDGSIHEQTVEYDEDRQALLESVGYQFIRFSNVDVLENWEFVERALKEKMGI